MPAAAQAASAELRVFLGNATVAAGGPGVVQEMFLYASEPVVLPEATVTVDFAGLGGVVDVSGQQGDSRCTLEPPTVLVCQDPFGVAVDQLGLAGFVDFVLTAAPGAAVGDSGTLTVTFAAPGITSTSHKATVRVGEAVDLAADPPAGPSPSAGPGQAFSAPLSISNRHDTPVHGLNVVFGEDYEMRPAVQHSNCTYAGGRLRSCAFDTTIGPDETFIADLAYTVAKDAAAPGKAFGARFVLTRAEFEDFADFLTGNGFDLGTPGTGPALDLKLDPDPSPQARTLASPVQADVDPENDSTSVNLTITGKNGTDVAAVGDTVTGAAGDEVTAEIGVANNGPATLDGERVGSAVTRVELVVPTGTTVVGVPAACSAMKGDGVDLDNPDRAGASRYRCRPGFLLIAGDSDTFTFRLRIDKVIADAAGTVEVNVPCACEGFTREQDLKPANDKAQLLVNPTSSGTGGQGGSGGQGEVLPITGSPTTLIAGAGAAMVLVGVGAYLLARRRREHFPA